MKRLTLLLILLLATGLLGCAYNKKSLMEYDYPYPAYNQTTYPYYPYNYNPAVYPYAYPYLVGPAPYYPYLPR